jgi:hypothetical protein
MDWFPLGFLVYVYGSNITIAAPVVQVQLSVELTEGAVCQIGIFNSANRAICSIGDWEAGLWGFNPGNYTSSWTDVLPGSYRVSIRWGGLLKGHLTVMGRSPADLRDLTLVVNGATVAVCVSVILVLFFRRERSNILR